MNRRAIPAEPCPTCQLRHVGVRACYYDRILAALGFGPGNLSTKEDRTLKWLAAVIDNQGATCLSDMIRRSTLAASRGGVVTPSACTDGQAVTKGEAPTLGASPLEAASVGGFTGYMCAKGYAHCFVPSCTMDGITLVRGSQVWAFCVAHGGLQYARECMERYGR